MKFPHLFIALSVAMLSGCSQMTVVSRNMATPPATADEIAYLTAGHVTNVVVASSPFANASPPALASSVAERMPRINNARFMPVSDVQPASDYLMIWHFAGRTDGLVTADLALVSPGDRPISRVEGHVDGVQGPDDPAFVRLIQQMTLSVLWPGRDLDGSGSPPRLVLF